ncbi:MAG TPA: hemopexin repeat-containing protein [Longimicrobium sp.]|nr:hemopexin repeat-containing protein [Longimicrobium sp.]
MGEALTKPVRGAINVTFGPFNGYAYFFHEDGTYSRFNRLTCELEYYAETAASWPGWPAQWKFPQAALTWDNEFAYFFSGPDFWRYDLIKDQGEDWTKEVATYWKRWPAQWRDRVDAGLWWGYHYGQKARKAYFFREGQYLRYDARSSVEGVDQGYPLDTRANWHRWPDRAPWNHVSAAVDWGNGKAYFFSGMEYLRYDKFTERVDEGYPRPLGEFIKEHQDKLAAERKSLLFEDQVPAGARPSFVRAVRALATELELRPNWLMASMWMESGFDPAAGLAAGNFIGLHQLGLSLIYQLWGKSALGGVPFDQLTPEARRKMAEAFAALGFDQIQVVAAWLRGSFKSIKPKCRSFDQLRLIGFGGAGLAQPDATPLAPVVARGNPRYDLSKDGKLDVAEFRAAVFDIIHAKLQAKPLVDSEVRHALG